MGIAIVTGASSGLGVEFAEAIIEKYRNLTEIWILARRKERLEKFAEKHPEILVRPVVLDVTKDVSYAELEELLKKEKPEIEILVNNAGYEKSGLFDEMDMRDIMGMVDVNVRGLTAVNRICFPYMKRGGFVIQTCSISSFVPIPSQSVYSASKVYVRYLGRGLREEMRRKGVNVFSLCPGNMDTEMNPKAVMDKSERKLKLPFLDLKIITRRSLEKAQAGKAIYTPGRFYKVYRLLSKIFPSAWMLGLTRKYYK